MTSHEGPVRRDPHPFVKNAVGSGTRHECEEHAARLQIYISHFSEIGYSSVPSECDMKILERESRRNLSVGFTSRRLSALLAATLLSAVTALGADDGNTVKVCIPQHTASNALLHQVTTNLSSHKPDKATHTKTQGVELLGIDQILHTDNPFKENLANQSLTTEVLDRANQEKCTYVLVISLPDVKTAQSGQPNVWSPERQATSNTSDPYTRRQDPEIYVEVKYRLYRLDAAPTSVDGFVTTHEAAPQNAVVSNALNMLANQVFTKITK
jgi:hypothetical protein